MVTILPHILISENVFLVVSQRIQPNEIEELIDAVFLMTDPLLYHNFGQEASLCSPGNQHYQTIIFFNFSSKNVEIGHQSSRTN